MSNRNMLVVTM